MSGQQNRRLAFRGETETLLMLLLLNNYLKYQCIFSQDGTFSSRQRCKDFREITELKRRQMWRGNKRVIHTCLDLLPNTIRSR